MNSSTVLTHTQSSLSFDIREAAGDLENECQWFWKPSTTQLRYLPNMLHPVLDFDKHQYMCYADAVNMVEVTADNLELVGSDIYPVDSSAPAILAKYLDHLTHVPDHPVRGRDLIFAHVNDLLGQNEVWHQTKQVAFDDLAKAIILPEFVPYLPETRITEEVHLITIDKINAMKSVIARITRMVTEFCKPYPHHMHFATLSYYDITIERGEDYRIYSNAIAREQERDRTDPNHN